MRLTEKQIEAIRQLFKKYFLKNDHIWLFGSRVDDTKRGGDIDLYIETGYDTISTMVTSKRSFLIELEEKIGEQKIDIVINQMNSNFHLPIYDEAKKTGVQLI